MYVPSKHSFLRLEVRSSVSLTLTRTHTHSLSISSHSSADPVPLSQQEVISFSLAFYVSSVCLLPIAVLSVSFVS